MSPPEPQKVAIITGASRGIGAGLVDGFRQNGYAVVGTALTMAPSDQPDYLTLTGDISQADTADRVVTAALDRFGRIDSLVNNAGIFIGEPFMDYSVEDYAAMTAVNLAGFFHITQRAIRQMCARDHPWPVPRVVVRAPPVTRVNGQFWGSDQAIRLPVACSDNPKSSCHVSRFV
jgi:NAD(P)-dependent dehydrogenase (short-subunit alcohol dehydrogenase family)